MCIVDAYAMHALGKIASKPFPKLASHSDLS